MSFAYKTISLSDLQSICCCRSSIPKPPCVPPDYPPNPTPPDCPSVDPPVIPSTDPSVDPPVIPPSSDEEILQGYYGVIYDYPTNDVNKLAATSQFTAVYGDPRMVETIFSLFQHDYADVTGDSSLVENVGGRCFFVTKNWGNPQSVIQNGFDIWQGTNFEPLTLVYEDTSYTGVIAALQTGYEDDLYQWTFT
jgi:hypothetical protein